MKLVRTNHRPKIVDNWLNFPSFFDDTFFDDYSSSSGLNLWEDDDKVYVEVSVPGMDNSDIDVNLENGILTVRAGKSKVEEENEKGKRVYTSSMKTNFFYSTSLPGNIDSSSVDAVLDKGILKITISKSEDAKLKKIEVKTKN